MSNIFEVLKRAEEGPYMKEGEFDMKLFRTATRLDPSTLSHRSIVLFSIKARSQPTHTSIPRPVPPEPEPVTVLFLITRSVEPSLPKIPPRPALVTVLPST